MLYFLCPDSDLLQGTQCVGGVPDDPGGSCQSDHVHTAEQERLQLLGGRVSTAGRNRFQLLWGRGGAG